MDGGKNYGRCTVCNGTMSVHINVSKPLNHRFTKWIYDGEALARRAAEQGFDTDPR